MCGISQVAATLEEKVVRAETLFCSTLILLLPVGRGCRTEADPHANSKSYQLLRHVIGLFFLMIMPRDYLWPEWKFQANTSVLTKSPYLAFLSWHPFCWNCCFIHYIQTWLYLPLHKKSCAGDTPFVAWDVIFQYRIKNLINFWLGVPISFFPTCKARLSVWTNHSASSLVNGWYRAMFCSIWCNFLTWMIVCKLIHFLLLPGYGNCNYSAITRHWGGSNGSFCDEVAHT